MEQYARYLRKSRLDRDYEDVSVEETLRRHEAILDKLAADRGLYIAKTYYEVVSGESIAARPEIRKLLAEVNAGIYAGVLVVDVERLARGNSSDQAYISEVFKYSGTKIITPLKTYDPENEFDEEYFEFGLYMSRREYKTINRRLTRGRDSSAAEGKYINSIAPYGYRRVKLPKEKGYTLAPMPVEAEHVQFIFARFLAGDGTKMIANHLNDQQIPTRHGGLWSYSTISNILKNPVYAGKIRRGWSKQVRSMENGVVKKRIKRNLQEQALYEGLHPALIHPEDFARTQELLSRKANANARPSEAFDLQNAFAGLIFCSICGKRIGRTVTAVSRGAVARLRCVNMRNCHNSSADYRVVEQAILDALSKWYNGYAVNIEQHDFEDTLFLCDRRLAATERRKEKLLQQLAQARSLVEQQVYSTSEFMERRAVLNDALAEAEHTCELLLTQRRALTENRPADLRPTTKRLLENYSNMTVSQKNKLLKEILDKIEYYKDNTSGIVIDLYPKLHAK